MKCHDPILFRQLPLIARIIQDETWLEGERRGCYVSESDPQVQQKVCEIVLRIGQELREQVSQGMNQQIEPAAEPHRHESAA